MRNILFSVVIVLSITHPASAQRDAKVPDPDPDLERKSFQVADGFEVNLFAADPLLAKPIQMNFDAAGRLWIASSEVYPQIKPGQKATDKVIVLEDTKGVGKADKVTVFAEGLLIPTGLEPGDGGVYVADSSELLHLSASKPGGKADQRRVVLSGFGTEDTHHMLHTLRWGPDGMLYMNQSIYIHSHIETPHGVRRLNAGGVWQFRPETMELGVFLHGFCNPWGHHFDRWGQSFCTDGAYGEGINYGLPGARYVFTPNESRIMWGLNPGSPKHCGLEIISGRHLPDDWQGNMITNDFRGHRVCRFVVTPDGAGYATREKPELLKTNHAAFRPIDVKMGPDGAIYIADWYNPIIQHGEVDFRDPRRDHVHGRIWRVTAKGRPLVPRRKLVDAANDELLDQLKAPEDWTRHFAKRVLKERGREKVTAALAAWVKKQNPSDTDYEHHLLESLWTYQSLDVVEPRLLDVLLHARDARARAAAVRVAQHWRTRLDHPLELLAERVADDHPQVRLEAVRALSRFQTARAAEIAMQALDRPVDKFLDYALWLTARELGPHWLPELQAGKLDFGGSARRLIFALQAVNSPAAVKPLVDLIQSGKMPPEREDSALTLLAALGGPKELAIVFDIVIDEKNPIGKRANLLAALEEAARQRQVKPGSHLSRADALLNVDSDALRAPAARVLGLWKIEASRHKLQCLAGAANVSDHLRQAACEGLALLGGEASRKEFERLTQQDHDLPIRRQALIALAAVDVHAAARRAGDVLAAHTERDDPAAIFLAFVQRKNGAAALALTLTGKLPIDVAKVGVRTVRGMSKDAGPLVEALTKAGGLTAGPRILSAVELKQLIADVSQHGDPARGEAIYRRKDQVCQKCHAIAGAGGQVGPDLTGIGASAQVDYLIESILQPNKAIKENYHSLNVALKDGRLVAGIPVLQTERELVLRDAEDREVPILVKEIEVKEQGGSLMPEGLADTLTRPELIDLVRFLSELGKVGPFSPTQARLVRRWQVLSPTAEAYDLGRRLNTSIAASDHPALVWTPAYSTVAATLPVADLPFFESKGHLNDTVIVRFQVEATTAGTVKLLLNSAAGMTAWLDRVPVDANELMELDLQTGLHTLTLEIHLPRRKQPLRVELEDVPNSPARARIIGGK